MLPIILILAIILFTSTVADVPKRLATQITQFSNFSVDAEFSTNESPATNRTISSNNIHMVNNLTLKQMVSISFI